MVKKNDELGKKINELRSAKKLAEMQLKQELKKKLVKVLDGVTLDLGFSLEEIASKVLGKQFASEKNKRAIYDILLEVRYDSDMCLAFKNGKYGWATTQEDIERYRLRNFANGITKATYNIVQTPKNLKAIGINNVPDWIVLAGQKMSEVKLLVDEQKDEKKVEEVIK
jgi:hypothetical protein